MEINTPKNRRKLEKAMILPNRPDNISDEDERADKTISNIPDNNRRLDPASTLFISVMVFKIIFY
jgi:hypothetical protein